MANSPRPAPTGRTTRDGRMALLPRFSSLRAPIARSPTTTRVRARSSDTSYCVRPIRNSAQTTSTNAITQAATTSSRQPCTAPTIQNTAVSAISIHPSGRTTPAA